MSLTIAQALAAFTGGTLPANTVIVDTARDISDGIDSLQSMVTAGKLLSITPLGIAKPTLAITPAQLSADAGALALLTTPYYLQERITASQATGATLSVGFYAFYVVDTAANVMANLPALETLYKTGLLFNMRFTDPGVPVLSMSAATLAANINALSLLGTPFTIALTDSGTPLVALQDWQTQTAAFTNVLARVTTPFRVTPGTVIRALEVASIVTGLDRSTDDFEQNSRAAAAVPNQTALSTTIIPSNAAVVDYEGNISTFLDSLEVAAKAGKITEIVMRDGGLQTLSLTTAQLANDKDALALITPDYSLSEVINVASALATPTLAAGFVSFTIVDSAANIVANLATIDAIVRAGHTPRIRIIDSSAPYLSLSAAQVGQYAYALSEINETLPAIALTDGGTPTITLSGDLVSNSNVRNDVLNYIVSPYKVAISGAVSAATITNVINENAGAPGGLVTPLTVVDFASNIAANIGALETLALAGELGSVTLLTGGVPSLGLTPTQISASTAALAKFVTPHTNATVTQTPTSLSSSALLSSLGALETQAEAGTLGSITLTDGGTPVLSMTAATFSADAYTIGKISSAYSISLTDGGTPTITLAAWQAGATGAVNAVGDITSAFNLALSGPISGFSVGNLVGAGEVSKLSAPVQVLDYVSNIGYGNYYLNALETLATAGKLGGVTLLNGAGTTLAITAAMDSADTAALALITTPYNLSEVVSAAAAPTTTVSGRFTSLTVADSAANIVANLAALETLAVNGTVTAIDITGTTPATLTLTTAQVSADMDALNKIPTSSYTITISDPTDYISLADWQDGGTATPNVLNRITSAYTWELNGAVRPSRVTQILAVGTIANNLAPGSLFIRDNSVNIEANFAALQTEVTAGKIGGIATNAGLQTFNVATSDPTTYAGVFADLITPYDLQENITVAGLAGATLATGFLNFAIKDTAANIVAALPQLETMALNHQIGNLFYTDTAPVLTMSAATLQADADALGFSYTSGTPVVLTDAGTPTITLRPDQLTYDMRNNILDAITGSYHLALSGPASAALASVIASENNAVLASLTAPINIADYSYNVSQDLDFIEYLGRNGELGTITLLDSIASTPTLNVTTAQAAADTHALGAITSAYTENVVACFGAGTRLLTQAGEAPVEALRVGDVLATRDGGLRPVRWIGRTRIDLGRHPTPENVAPIRIHTNAFAPGMPHRDLLLSPDHAVAIDDALVPVHKLVNGATISREAASGVVTYFHVELDRHAIVFAEGLPAETYLDAGNRFVFEDEAVRALHPDLCADLGRRAWDECSCMPLLLGGPAVTAAHARLNDRAAALGHALTDDPALLLLADGIALPLSIDADGALAARLPAGATRITLRSRSAIPRELDSDSDDDRRLGVALASLRLGRAMLDLRTLAGEGLHAAEEAWRWTNGEATITVAPSSRPRRLTLTLRAGFRRYRAA